MTPDLRRRLCAYELFGMLYGATVEIEMAASRIIDACAERRGAVKAGAA